MSAAIPLARSSLRGDEAEPSHLMPRFFAAQAEALSRQRKKVPEDPAWWPEFRRRLLDKHARALGVEVAHKAEPIEFDVVAILERDGYTLKKILFESRPGVRIPAHLYFPRPLDGKAPAVLCVHGHWNGAKNAPPVHTRSVFLARRGFVVLALDAIGAGERAWRGITYHGRQLGYQVLPAGLTLAGLQVLDNRRAVDLLCGLPEVDPQRIGVTGASGGGNQTFHLAILDERVRAAVGVCFFGAYEGYLRGAHCACETVPGVLTYAEEGELAGLVAPRAFLVIAAKEDSGAAFRIGDARRSAAVAQSAYRVAGAEGKFRLLEFEGGHDYSRPMREAMVAFCERELRGVDAGESVPEPPLDLLGAEELRVLAPGGLGEGRSHVPVIAMAAADRIVNGSETYVTRRWGDPDLRFDLRPRLVDGVFGGFPQWVDFGKIESRWLEGTSALGGLRDCRTFRFPTEKGVELDLVVSRLLTPASQPERVLLIVGSARAAIDDAFLDRVTGGNKDRLAVAALAPRGTGRTTWPEAKTVNCDDYLLAQGSLVLGRPMLGQWVLDVLRACECLRLLAPEARIGVYGEGVLGLAALLAGVLDERIAAVGASDMLASYVHAGRFDDRWGLVHFVPGILELGDVSDLAAGIAPRPLILGALRSAGGEALDASALDGFLEHARAVADGGFQAVRVEVRWKAAEVFDALAVELFGTKER
jgi:cephalosporin-C deacetylase-like acetyl esterase